ncbi:uncharacterized protein LOC120351318 isoform X2 [Nilaparvata lugens]|uniref:uncharacterized protein LOC120351318 isoform X2 n=1 Tax=Nilaparvata lugens TaxID=108931 RepID=UPI00193E9819|nr:uncharacterized protein LOC120351318 isoform X2 [Nilaparvata lugens]
MNEKIDNNSGQDFLQEALPVIQNEIPVITSLPESQDEMINSFVANDSQSVYDDNIISSSSLQINEMDIEYYVVDETIDNNSGQDFSQEVPPVIQNEIPVITPVPESHDEMINPFVANDSQSVHDLRNMEILTQKRNH